MPTARTRVVTDRASRYLVQLCEHLDQMEHRAQHRGAPATPGALRVEWTDVHGVITFAGGRCTLDATDDALDLHLVADDAQELSRMQTVFAARIETIGRRDNLHVAW